MEHDDRTRDANLRRLRKPRTAPTLGDQLSVFNPGTSATPLIDLAVSLALSLGRLLPLLDEDPITQETRTQLKQLRQEIALDLSHFQDLRASAALSIAMQDIRRHLGLSRA